MTPQPTSTPEPGSRRTPARRSRRTRGSALAVYATTAALFVTTFGFLGLRVAQGQDPSLGSQTAKTTTVASTSAATAASTTPTTTASSSSTVTPVQTSTS